MSIWGDFTIPRDQWRISPPLWKPDIGESALAFDQPRRSNRQWMNSLPTSMPVFNIDQSKRFTSLL
ncbi:MAG: hypothetical protein OXF08_09150 [Bacteroidetes bacterium]|nr:hypothetical protein [Bacteroidota bacterium]